MSIASDHTLPDRLRRMVDAIVDEVDPSQIVLFGSQARGDATAASDVDLLIIVEESFQNGRSRMEMMTQLWQALSDVRGPKDLLVYSRDDVEKWKDTSNHVVARTLREGEVLYRSVTTDVNHFPRRQRTVDSRKQRTDFGSLFTYRYER
jgi:predicted nucleotidyltransferase